MVVSALPETHHVKKALAPIAVPKWVPKFPRVLRCGRLRDLLRSIPFNRLCLSKHQHLFFFSFLRDFWVLSDSAGCRSRPAPQCWRAAALGPGVLWLGGSWRGAPLCWGLSDGAEGYQIVLQVCWQICSLFMNSYMQCNTDRTLKQYLKQSIQISFPLARTKTLDLDSSASPEESTTNTAKTN